VGVHRSRYELERVLGRYGASDFAFVEADANASIQFAMDGRYVQVALPLPDPNASDFTHTPSGRPRTPTAQERAYEQALREHWRALLLAVRGKLQSVESGISTFDAEFAGFLVPHFEEDRKKKGARRKKPKAVNWLLGSSHSVAIALVAAFLVPASAVGAFALPPNVVDHLAAPFRGALRDQLAVPSAQTRALALGQSSWVGGETPSHGDRISLAAERKFAVSLGGGEDGVADAASGESSGIELDLLRNDVGGGSGSAPSSGGAPAPSGAPASSGEKQGSQGPAGPGGPAAPPEQSDADPPSAGGSDDPPADDSSAEDADTDSASENAGDAGAEATGGETSETGSDSTGSVDESAASDSASDTEAGDNGHDNGNHNGADNGNKNGADNGNKNEAPTPPAADADYGNGNGNANGADKDKKTDPPADDKPKPGKGDAKAGH
jgi:hypothetical protein